MLEKNEKITLSGQEALEALKEIEFILISLHKMGSFYAEKPGAIEEYRKATTDFIDNGSITQRLTKVRAIISRHFDDSLGDDEMDDIERYFSDLVFWKPGQPLSPKTHNIELDAPPSGMIQQITCKQSELLVVLNNQQNEHVLITFHNPTDFKGTSPMSIEACDIREEKYCAPSQNTDSTAATKNQNRYCFTTHQEKKVILSVIADSYSVEQI